MTAAGLAETGCSRQGRRLWESADKILGAGGELLVLHDTCQAVAILGAVGAASVTIAWDDGTVSTVRPPRAGGSP